tara:strand:+ start:65798 stop:66511 length:714 start_codon:yes stop_codon:yes gene_type:complete
MQLILLSAGRGSRLSQSLRKKPKSLAKINDKSILEHNINFFNKFKKKYIITGFKGNLIKNFAKKYNFKRIHNINYKSTNMVYSTFLSTKYIKEDVVVCYGDIIFDSSIYEILKERKNIIPLNKNWLSLWKKRMKKNKIIKDAENVEIKKNILKSIGGKIETKLPKYQYMGIFKLKKESFLKLSYFFKKIRDKKIDMTTFLNESIRKKQVKFNIKTYSKIWFEIDNFKDIKVASKELN